MASMGGDEDEWLKLKKKKKKKKPAEGRGCEEEEDQAMDAEYIRLLKRLYSLGPRAGMAQTSARREGGDDDGGRTTGGFGGEHWRPFPEVLVSANGEQRACMSSTDNQGVDEDRSDHFRTRTFTVTETVSDFRARVCRRVFRPAEHLLQCIDNAYRERASPSRTADHVGLVWWRCRMDDVKDTLEVLTEYAMPPRRIANDHGDGDCENALPSNDICVAVPSAHLSVHSIIEDYVENLVMCSVCRMPDTWLRTSAPASNESSSPSDKCGATDRVTHVQCTVCGNVDEVFTLAAMVGERLNCRAESTFEVSACGLQRHRRIA